MYIWNTWHGCHKFSEGCRNCYVYRRDSTFGKDSSLVTKTAAFDAIIKKDRCGNYKVTPEDSPIYTCMTSDFFIEEADLWRSEIWKMIRMRPELSFVIITKRIHRVRACLPEDWGSGYDNVILCCTVENQAAAQDRLPELLSLPLKHRQIIHEPMLEQIDIRPYLAQGKIQKVICGGESGSQARCCHYEWILETRQQCIESNTAFYFKQTGSLFEKDGRLFHIDRSQQLRQAKKADIDFTPINYDPILKKLSASDFRSRFQLDSKDLEYIRTKGMDTILHHAQDFVAKRLAPGELPNDGKQTPMKGHPVFKAQHACACCCRGCLSKWHDLPPGRQLSPSEQDYVTGLLMAWIRRQLSQREDEKRRNNT